MFLQLIDIIVKEELQSRVAALCRKKSKAGYDRMSAFAASQWKQVNAGVLCEKLLSGRYQPAPTVGVHTAQKSGVRCLGRLTMIDTAVQHVLTCVVPAVRGKVFPT